MDRPFALGVAARDSDLQLPEFVAFRDQQQLPRMRTWELPYSLFAARLRETAAVLDCTINPCGFGDRLTRLYPHVSYRHWNPIQQGRLALPVGVPEGAFDCVFCINTLEHLMRHQREALVADLARRLKGGGRLVMTSDFYFDSFWSQPHLLSAGVVRADGLEVFNGFNKLTARDWVALCEPHGLRALQAPEADPHEDDPTLFRNTHPYPHACIGGVFVKGDDDLACPPRTVMLALLAWNTCPITVDSVRAYLREARMLRRIGHQPLLCICDNGSDDGTADALRLLEGEIDVSCRFILNGRNRGSSIARNQMIDYAREAGVDYILFMDGDIEVVPFSSVAMMRYLEAGGPWLGCIGANSTGQTTLRERATPSFYSVHGHPVASTTAVAWTQYGMFRRAMFDDGVRFDEASPFDGPGWGFEDNDLAFQMEIRGYRNEYFTGMTYLHRAVQSSVRNLRRSGLDANDLFMRRKRYVIDKWAGVPAINSGPLEHIRRFHHLV
jgi:hypothetical protein